MLFQKQLPALLTFLATFAVLSACTGSDDQAGVAGDIDTTMDTLVSAAWLRELSLPFINPEDIFKQLGERIHGAARQLA